MTDVAGSVRTRDLQRGLEILVKLGEAERRIKVPGHHYVYRLARGGDV